MKKIINLFICWRMVSDERVWLYLSYMLHWKEQLCVSHYFAVFGFQRFSTYLLACCSGCLRQRFRRRRQLRNVNFKRKTSNGIFSLSWIYSYNVKLLTIGTIEPAGVNFINILHTAFRLVDHKSIKKIDNLTVFFTLLGSASVRAVCRMLMKLSPVEIGILVC